MSKKLIFLTSVVLLVALAGNASGALKVIWWCDGEPNNPKWEEPNNWDPNDIGYPNDSTLANGYQVFIPRTDLWVGGPNEPNFWPLIDGNSPSDCCSYQLFPGYVKASDNPTGYGQFDLTGGQVETLHIGWNQPDVCSVFNMSGGTFTSRGIWDIAVSGHGTHTITGGQVYCSWPWHGFGICVARYSSGIAYLNLYGGTVMTGNFGLRGASPYGLTGNVAQGQGWVDMTEGTLIISGDFVNYVMARVNDPCHWFTAYGAYQSINAVYYPDYPDSGGQGATVVTATDPKNAHFPDPQHGSDYVPIEKVLSWTPGVLSDTRKVYFGTSLSDANQSATPVDTNTADVNSFDPYGAVKMQIGVHYYWRVESVNTPDFKTWSGDIWEFTTDDGTCSNPNPGNRAGGVPPAATLSWAPGTWTATPSSFDVYLATGFDDVNEANNLDTVGVVYQGNKNVNDFDPGGLDLQTRYFWRIDDANGGHPNSPFKGRIWYFDVGATTIDDFESYTGTGAPPYDL